MNDNEIIALAKNMHWAHPIELTKDFCTRPQFHVRRRFNRRLKLMQIPNDLSGKTILDIGAWDGYFSFEFERRGAKRVMAIDTYAWDTYGMDSFLLAHKALKSRVEYQRLDVNDIDKFDIGRFDIVFFAGVLYHLKKPLTVLEKLHSITDELLICETHAMLPFIHERFPLISYFPGDEIALDNKWELCAVPTMAWLKEAFHAAGFKNLDYKYTPSLRYWKKFLSLLTNKPQSGRCIVHATP